MKGSFSKGIESQISREQTKLRIREKLNKLIALRDFPRRFILAKQEIISLATKKETRELFTECMCEIHMEASAKDFEGRLGVVKGLEAIAYIADIENPNNKKEGVFNKQIYEEMLREVSPLLICHALYHLCRGVINYGVLEGNPRASYLGAMATEEQMVELLKKEDLRSFLTLYAGFLLPISDLASMSAEQLKYLKRILETDWSPDIQGKFFKEDGIRQEEFNPSRIRLTQAKILEAALAYLENQDYQSILAEIPTEDCPLLIFLVEGTNPEYDDYYVNKQNIKLYNTGLNKRLEPKDILDLYIRSRENFSKKNKQPNKKNVKSKGFGSK